MAVSGHSLDQVGIEVWARADPGRAAQNVSPEVAGAVRRLNRF